MLQSVTFNEQCYSFTIYLIGVVVSSVKPLDFVINSSYSSAIDFNGLSERGICISHVYSVVDVNELADVVAESRGW